MLVTNATIDDLGFFKHCWELKGIALFAIALITLFAVGLFIPKKIPRWNCLSIVGLVIVLLVPTIDFAIKEMTLNRNSMVQGESIHMLAAAPFLPIQATQQPASLLYNTKYALVLSTVIMPAVIYAGLVLQRQQLGD